MRKFKVIAVLLLHFVSLNELAAQFYFTVSEEQQEVVKVLDNDKETVLFPWAGGMNSCQFAEIDMNLDGIEDLIVFDRMGDRIMPFINGGGVNQIDYQYAPEYIPLFPELFDWAIFKDYNGDGLEDIFTYAKDYPGIIVYKNTSLANLEFELVVYPFLTSLQGGGQVNILTTDVDYPGIDDIDNDGDLDILTFWGLGSFVEYHENQSMELYGIPDSLEYVEMTQCWGFFAESDESNHIYLDTCMGQQGSTESDFVSSGVRHTGSTFLLIDLDADNDKDLLLGDVDYPGLIGLTNGGTPDSAYMVNQDTAFPSYNKPINLFSMPAAAYIDVNNNGIKDLLLSPFDPSLVTSVNARSAWLYENSGSNDLPDFNYIMQDFLQQDMIDLGSGAYPVLEDYDGDGLMDLFVSNYGYYMYSYYDPSMILHSVYWSNIALYQNTGTASSPEFTHVTHDFAGLHTHHLTGLFPTFGDVDGDGDKDMVTGSQNGALAFHENTAGAGNEMVFADPVFNYMGIDIGEFSAPQLFDLNSDERIDLAIGEKNGNMNYYENVGTIQVPQFALITDSLGNVNVTDYNISYSGYSTPWFFKNPQGDIELIVGSEEGKLFYYTDISNNLEGSFTENDSLYIVIDDEAINIDQGIRTGATIGELNADGIPELIAGNYSGGLHYYKGIDQPPVAGNNEQRSCHQLEIYPNPAKEKIKIKTDRFAHAVIVQVYNAYGQLLLQRGYEELKEVELDVSILKSGLYFIRCYPAGDPKAVLPGSFIKPDW